ncbi:hypothetical protein D9758_017492 [Tetrapyrgos nigripes]|uniref:CHAT domain-containing protein n=1 Tax=Tetrapyrgos nigripes TaxID=182062 RepID=A0A8H5C0M9_9AGAR|nr:hypothetical protein D9758_017492 [Tetrapyrgos nigripes]
MRYNEDEAVELERMSLGQSNAETTENSSVNYTPIDMEEQAELDQALFLSSLPSGLFDEQAAQLHKTTAEVELLSGWESSVNLMKAGELNNSAVQLAEHFKQSGDCAEIDSAVQLMEAAIKLIPDGHVAAKADTLKNLGMVFQSRFECLRELGDIEKAIYFNQQAINLTPDGHADKASRLNSLGLAFHCRFEHLGDLGDIENAIHFERQGVDLMPDSHASKASCLNNLGGAFLLRFVHLRELGDIENAIHFSQQATNLIPDGHASKALWLSNLGLAFSLRFRHLGEVGDIKNVIHFQQQAVDMTPDGHPSKASWLNNLGLAFSSRFEHLGELGDIENAIHFKRQAVDLTPDGYADKPSWLNSLGLAFLCRFEHLGELGDFENAIHFIQQAIDLTPDGHTDKVSWLNNLGIAFSRRFEHLGELGDIENAICFKQQAVDLTPDGHADKPAQLNSLGLAFFRQFEHLGELGDIENAIHFIQQAIDLIPDGHASKAAWLNHLGIAFSCRFEHLGELGDIKNAIHLQQQAVDLTPDGHADKPSLLNNLANAFQYRFVHLGELGDIENTIHFSRQAIDLTPDGHADKPSWLNSLGSAFSRRFERLGELGDIENAIHFQRQAVELMPDGHDASKANKLNALGSAFLRRFERLGELGDIENAIHFNQQAVDLTPDGHAGKPSVLNSLGNVFLRRFEHVGELGNIENAIHFMQQAVDLTPDGHAGKPSRLNNLGLAFLRRFEHLREMGDIENAIHFNQQAVNLTPDGNAGKATWLSNLGLAFSHRFRCLGELGDIGNAINFNQQAVNLTPDGHADKSAMLINLGIAFQSRFMCLGEPGDIENAVSTFQQSTKDTSSPPSIRYDAACRWATLRSFSYQDSSSALDAYKVALEIIPQLVWLGQTVHQRYKELPKIGRTINAAVATAISTGNLTQAVEWLEEGRGIVWGQILQLRSPLDELHDKDPDLAEQLVITSKDLENAGTSTHSNAIENLNMHATTTGEAQRHTELATRYEALIVEVRKLDGFDSFLKPKKLSALTPAAANGPTIMINVDESHCDALVLSSSPNIIHIPLPDFSSEQAKELHSGLISSLRASHVRVDRNGERIMRPAEIVDGNLFKSVLADLWTNVVHPILSGIDDVLRDYSAEDCHPHITWCATGALAFLPLHAAGIYGAEDASHNIKLRVSDLAVSSYTTTLSAMLNSGGKMKRDTREKPKVLIVSQPATPAMPPLPGTEEEAKIIQTYTSLEHSFHLTREEAVVETVKREMSKYEIIHLACHGIQDLENPLDSAFALYDGRLKLHDLMHLSLDNAELAVLSACQTAAGDEKLPEEAVHLAAGMLAVGYPSVIATMWSIRDKDAPVVAEKFYESLFGHSNELVTLNPRQSAAYALHAAVKHLRKEVVSESEASNRETEREIGAKRKSPKCPNTATEAYKALTPLQSMSMTQAHQPAGRASNLFFFAQQTSKVIKNLGNNPSLKYFANWIKWIDYLTPTPLLQRDVGQFVLNLIILNIRSKTTHKVSPSITIKQISSLFIFLPTPTRFQSVFFGVGRRMMGSSINLVEPSLLIQPWCTNSLRFTGIGQEWDECNEIVDSALLPPH